MTDIPDWVGKYEEVPRDVAAFPFSALLPNIDTAFRHQHRQYQLLYCAKGVLTCEVDSGIYIVPAQTAVWIPGGLPHKAFGTGSVECVSLMIEPGSHPQLPTMCCTIGVSALLRELIHAAVEMSPLYENEDRGGRIASLLLDELAIAKPESLALPMPKDKRFSRLAAYMLEHPGNDRTQEDWARSLGMSERNFRRLFRDAFGMNYGRWCHQLHIILAIKRMIAGERVQTIALDLGYENASSFVTMFRKSLGKPPARYLAEQMLR